jgi:hypothetical protein
MKKIYIAFVLLVLSSYSFAQITKITQLTDFTVIENGDTLKNPFAGGISAPEYSTMDLNYDGIKDLVIFDKDGSKVSCFLNGGTPNKIDYTYAPQYASKFPAGLYDWALFRDYNGDGKEDIFTQGRWGIRVFKNTSTGTDISFVLETDVVNADYGSIVSNISVSASDVPEIIDIDSDGDLDLFVFTATGGLQGDEVYFYKNFSIETTGTADSLTKYVVYKRCWGRFIEDYNGCIVELQASAGECGTGDKPELTPQQIEQIRAQRNSSNGRHAGSSILIFDANGDGKYDILVGDVGCSSMYMLTNSNTNSEAIMTTADYQYPPSFPVDVYIFPSAFYLDVNNDGKRDLLIATTGSKGTSNYNTTWLYLNNGTDAAPDFSLSTKSFLQNEMIDVKQNASPHFFDYDQDGKIDLAIANSGSWLKDTLINAIDSASVTIYKNIGTNTAPVYELVSRDYNFISQYHLLNLAISTADLDEDGDPDMIVGSENGMIHYFSNNATAGAPADFHLHTPLYQNIDAGKFSIPQLIDVNNDNKADLLLGGRVIYDHIDLYTDTSTSNVLPEFKLNTDLLGNVKNAVPFSTGCSMFLNLNYDQNGRNSLFASKGGMIYFFDNIPADLSGSYTKTDSIYPNMGLSLRISMQDINGDDKKELIVGTSAGGLGIFELEYYTAPVGIRYTVDDLFAIYPNPANNQITISSKKGQQISRVEIYDIVGKLIRSQYLMNGSSLTIPTDHLNNGNYIIKIYSNSTVNNKLIMVSH